MENRNGLALVLNYNSTSTYAFNVLLGALETIFGLEEIEVFCVKKYSDATPIITHALSQQKKVLVCWSFYSTNFTEVVSEFQLLKREVSHADIIHLAGGVHATAEPEQTLNAGFDFIAIGEGEKTIIEFISKLLKNENYSQTNGIAYLSEAGGMISNGSGDRIDLNDFPPFAQKHRKFNPIEITRGCVYACKFCQTPFMFKARFRHRTVENICHYVQVMKDNGLTEIRFITPTSLSYGSNDESVQLDKIEEVLSSIRRVLGEKGRIFFGSFPSEVRPEHVSLAALQVLKKYVANNNIIIGGQTGSQYILDRSKRGHSVESIIDAVRISVEVGFIPNVDFIFGLPGETEIDAKLSLKLAEQLSEMGARIHGHTFMPLPGTPFKSAKPGRISQTTLKSLHRLESRGALYGQWEKQKTVAQDLAKLHDAKRIS